MIGFGICVWNFVWALEKEEVSALVSLGIGTMAMGTFLYNREMSAKFIFRSMERL
jgi:hypothetical protein